MADEEKVLPDPIEIEGIRIGDDRFKIKAGLDLNRKPDSKIGYGSVARSSDPNNPAVAEYPNGYALGIDTQADSHSFALGYRAKAKGSSSFVHGVYTNIDDIQAYNIAEGTGAASFNGADAAANYSFACNRGIAGTGSVVGETGNYSFACGGSSSSGDYSHAEGKDCNSGGKYSHAEGFNTNAYGKGSHVEGYACTAGGDGYSHAEGYQSSAGEEGSHAEGFNTKTYGKYSHAEGSNCVTYELNSHAEGEECVTGHEQNSGFNSHAEGYQSKAYNTSHAEGTKNIAYLGSHAEGRESKAYGFSHVEGIACIAGRSPEDSGLPNHWYGAHAQGVECIASGDYSFAGGNNCQATSENSIALGLNLLSNSRCKTVIGMNNDPDDTRGSAFCIGNGTIVGGGGESSSGRSDKKNCFMVDYSGNVWVGGKITCGSRGTVALSSDFNDYYKKDEIKNNLLPSVTAADNGKILSVVNGVWAATTIVNAEGVAY